jgi:hypothetical protein
MTRFHSELAKTAKKPAIVRHLNLATLQRLAARPWKPGMALVRDALLGGDMPAAHGVAIDVYREDNPFLKV